MIIWLALYCHLDYISIEDCFYTEIILVFFSFFSLLIIRIEFFGSFLSGEWWMFSLFSFRFFSIAWSWLLSEILSASNLCYLYSGVVVTEATRGSVSGFFLFFWCGTLVATATSDYCHIFTFACSPFVCWQFLSFNVICFLHFLF